MNVYFISGLGADRRAFDNIKLSESYEVHHIDWLDPLPEEPLQDYAHRMAQSIDAKKPFVLVGLSFGGIMSIEIAKFLQPKLIILISSVSHRGQLPWYYRVSGKLKIPALGVTRLIKKNSLVMFWFFGTKSKRLKEYLQEMIDKTSDNYVQWSLSEIANWQQKEKPNNVFHIHGNTDKLFPLKYVKPDMVLDHGSHFMVVTHGDKISNQINTLLNELNHH